MGILTLLTDFGTHDIYVGVMKGAIAQINPTLTLIDLTHDIPPQDLAAARFQLLTAVPYFPAGTVHLAVVDPGVGGSRRAIALQTPFGYLVGPDNGIWSGVLEAANTPVLSAVELNNPAYWRVARPSPTFHGRDLFAPVAAHLASGVPLTQLGTAIDPASLVILPLPIVQRIGATIHGCIQSIDHFGNLITNISGNTLPCDSWQIEIGRRAIAGHQTYADQPPGTLLALIGSHGFVEIAITCGNAQNQLAVTVGTPVKLGPAASSS